MAGLAANAGSGRKVVGAAWLRWTLALALGTAMVLGLVREGSRKMLSRQAARELAELEGLLQQFHVLHGRYPQVSHPAQFFDVLIGRADAFGKPGNLRRLIDPSRFSSSALDPLTPGNRLLDPWGQPYRYYFLHAANDGRGMYLLYSVGPDGTTSNPFLWLDGRGREPEDTDNVYVAAPTSG